MPPIRPELLDGLLKDYQKPDDLLGQGGLLRQLTKALVERALDGGLTHHLGYERHDSSGDNSGSSRNGTSPETMRGKRGQVHLDAPRDRDSSFEPQLVKKGQTRFGGLDEEIIPLYARGMTQRETRGHLEEIYGVESSPSLVSTVTDAVLDEVRAWQSRPLDAAHPILYLDALQVKVKSQGRVQNKATHLAFGVNLQGLKEVLGMWASDNEGAKFRMRVVTELKDRGVQDIFIACVGGLKGFPEAIEAVFPQTQAQLCMVHMARRSLSYVSHKDRKAVAEGLKEVYQAATVGEAGRQLGQSEEAWAVSCPVIARSWRRNRARVAPMSSYPAGIRRAVYATNTIGSPNMTLRKVSKNRAMFPSDEAVFRLMYPALRNISRRWTMPVRNWSGALNQFAILSDGRAPMGGLNQNSLTQNL